MPILQPLRRQASYGRKALESWLTGRSIRSQYMSEQLPNLEGRQILHYSGISSLALTPIELALFHLLRQEGCSVDYFVYDESIPITEVTTRERETQLGDQFWKRSVATGRRLLRSAGVPYREIPVSPEAIAIVKDLDDLEEILGFEFDEIHFGPIVFGAMSRYYKATTFPSVGSEDVARRILTTALTNYLKVKDLTERHDYDLVLFSHGIYMTWGPVVELCKKKGVDFVCYDRAKTRDHYTFNTNRPSPEWNFDTAWNRYSEIDLTESEHERASQYLQEREFQAGDFYSYNPTERETNLGEVRHRLEIPPEAKCITLCTNLIWDAANASRDLVFNSMLECVVQTIHHYENQPDTQILLRTHPAEEVLGTQERYADLVRSRLGSELPSNLTILDHTAKVNSFTVIDLTDVAVVNTSTVGLEMAVFGKPTVVVGNTHYRGKGFTFDPNSRSEYFDNLEYCLTTPSVDDSRSLALKYFYMMMFEYQLKMPTLLTDQPTHRYLLRRNTHNQDELTLRRIARTLAKETPPDFMDWRTA